MQATQVTFPALLDVYELCSSDLKAELQRPRELLKDYEDAKAVAAKAKKPGEVSISSTEAVIPVGGDTVMANADGTATSSTARSAALLTGMQHVLHVL